MAVERCSEYQTPPNPEPEAAELCWLCQFVDAPCIDHSVEDADEDDDTPEAIEAVREKVAAVLMLALEPCMSGVDIRVKTYVL